MSRSLLAGLIVLAVLMAGAPAFGAPKILVKTRTYDISGATGRALLEAMDRKGPKHGFMTRAIAQTSYTLDWELDVKRTGDACRLTAAKGTLNVLYTFPRVTSELSPALRKRWQRFFAGVKKHEMNHGRIAGEMIRAATRSVRAVGFQRDASCNMTRREAKRRIDAVYQAYEEKQVAFDTREHGTGGTVEKLVDALLRAH